MFNQENTLCFPKNFDSPGINPYNVKNIHPCAPGLVFGGVTKKKQHQIPDSQAKSRISISLYAQ